MEFWEKLVRQLVYTLFITNNHVSFMVKENLVKFKNISKYHVHDFLFYVFISSSNY